MRGLARKGATSPQRIMIGGQINDEIRKCADAEAHGRDAMAAVLFAKGWIGGK